MQAEYRLSFRKYRPSQNALILFLSAIKYSHEVNAMKIEISIEKELEERRVVIHTEKVDGEITEIIEKINGQTSERADSVTAFDDNGALFLDPRDICRIYSADKKVFAETAEGTYTLKSRIYELENFLDSRVFMRISNSEIINLRQVKRMDTSLTGTICVSLKNGTLTYASRRYVAQIRRQLDI